MNEVKVRSRFKTRNITRVAVLSVIAFVLMNIKTPLGFIAPSFMKLDISDMPVLIGAFTMGPVYGVITALIKNILKIIIAGSDTGLVGELSNFIVASAFAVTASLFYRKHRTFKGAIGSLALGIITMTALAMLSNYFFIFPLYGKIMPMEAIISMCSKINANVKGLKDIMVYVVLPFNLVKGTITAIFTIFIYKHVRPALKD